MPHCWAMVRQDCWNVVVPVLQGEMATTLHKSARPIKASETGLVSKDRQGLAGCPQLRGAFAGNLEFCIFNAANPRFGGKTAIVALHAHGTAGSFPQLTSRPNRRGQAADDAPSQSRHVACQLPAANHERLSTQLVAYRQSPAHGIANLSRAAARSSRRPPPSPPRNWAAIHPRRHGREGDGENVNPVTQRWNPYMAGDNRAAMGGPKFNQDVTVRRDVAPCVMQ